MINNCNTLPLCASFYRLHFNTIVHFQDDNKYLSTFKDFHIILYSEILTDVKDVLVEMNYFLVELNTISRNLCDDLIFAITFTSHINKCTEIKSSKIFCKIFFKLQKMTVTKVLLIFPIFTNFVMRKKKTPHIRCNMCD